MNTTYIGIDYGLGNTNRDPKTGMQYGVISQHSVGQAWYDDAEPDYGNPCCPKCGNDALAFSACEEDTDNWEQAKYEGRDYVCLACQYVFGSESAYGEEPRGFTYEDTDYSLTDCLDSDIMILRSPYYTHAQHCSPCVPGAGNLDNPTDDTGPKTFCLGAEWFEDGKAPYRVFRVSDNTEVLTTYAR